MCEAFRQLEERGKKNGELKLSKLIKMLIDENLTRDIALVTSDENAREEYYIKYGIQ